MNCWWSGEGAIEMGADKDEEHLVLRKGNGANMQLFRPFSLLNLWFQKSAWSDLVTTYVRFKVTPKAIALVLSDHPTPQTPFTQTRVHSYALDSIVPKVNMAFPFSSNSHGDVARHWYHVKLPKHRIRHYFQTYMIWTCLSSSIRIHDWMQLEI